MNALKQPQVKLTGSSSVGSRSLGLIQRKCACGGIPGLTGECAECAEKKLQRKALDSEADTRNSTLGTRHDSRVPNIVHEVLRSPGQPLDAQTRAFMEPRFAHDFSQVRVHTDARAAESARAVNALAYTVANHIVFGAGQPSLGSSNWYRLMAHELTHVVQNSGQIVPHFGLVVGRNDSDFEAQAAGVTNKLMLGIYSGSPTRIEPAAISSDAEPAIRRWMISGAIAKSERDNEPLEELAVKVSGEKEDWRCIQPVRMRHFTPPTKASRGEPQKYQTFVRKHDRFDVSNLTRQKGETLKIHLFKPNTKEANVAERFYPGSQSSIDGDASIKVQASHGRTPISNFLIFGHYSQGQMWGDASSFVARNFKPELPVAKFEDALAGLLPRRCWFTRNATARSVGCESKVWGEEFSAAYLRKGATITTTTKKVASKCKVFPGGGQCQNPDQLVFVEGPLNKEVDGPFDSADQFHVGKFWATIPGKL